MPARSPMHLECRPFCCIHSPESLSAYGMGLASIRAHRTQALIQPLSESIHEVVAESLAKLQAESESELQSQGVSNSETTSFFRVHIRYDGTDTPIPVAFSTVDAMRKAFEETHRRQFGFTFENKGLIVEAVEVESVGGGAGIAEPLSALDDRVVEGGSSVDIFTAGEWRKAGVHMRADLKPGHRVSGPALIIEPHQTIVVEPQWQAQINAPGHVVLTRLVPMRREAAIGTGKAGEGADPVMLEVFNNLFMSIAEQMGVTLQNTAYSVNIKERLDFSCAVFAADGSLVANAPHMPVHLGSMDRSVETVIEKNKGNIHPGDVYVLNAPYNGGTHLPDITVVTPVFAEGSETEILFWTASRGHHADIGGMAPGSADAARHPCGRGRRADRQFPSGRSRRHPRGADDRTADLAPMARRAIRRRTWPTCAPRSPPTKRA